VAMFNLFFPTGTRPAVARHVTVPAGPAPTGTPEQETLLTTLVQLGNGADASRHCELVAFARSGAPTTRPRSWFLTGGVGTGGLWTTDVDGEPQVSTATLRENAGGPITFLCATTGSGLRLGADRDLDTHRNGSDCSDGDANFFATPVDAANLIVSATSPTLLSWDPQPGTVAPTVFHEVAGGMLNALTSGLPAATACVSGTVSGATQYEDTRPNPPVGNGYFYLVRARTPECNGGFNTSSPTIESLDCTSH